MIIHKRFFPKILLDNEEIYFNSLSGAIEAIDELSSMEIIKLGDIYNFRIAPSTPQYILPLLEEIFKFHNLLRLKIDVSKSIKSSCTIVFSINLQE